MSTGIPWPTDGSWEYPGNGGSQTWTPGSLPVGPLPPSGGPTYSEGGSHQWAVPPPIVSVPPAMGPPPPAGPPPSIVSVPPTIGPLPLGGPLPHIGSLPPPIGPPPTTGPPPPAGPPPHIGSVPPPIGAPPPNGPPPPIGPLPPTGPPLPAGPPPSVGPPVMGGPPPTVGLPTGILPSALAPLSIAAPPPPQDTTASYSNSIPVVGAGGHNVNYNSQHLFPPPLTTGVPDPYSSAANQVVSQQSDPHISYGTQYPIVSGVGPPPPHQSYPSQGHSAMPLTGPLPNGGYYGDVGFTGSATHSAHTSDYPVEGPPNSSSGGDSFPSFTKDGWDDKDWVGHWDSKHRTYTKEISSKSSGDRSRGSYRESDHHGRDERHSSSGDQDGTISRYKDRHSRESFYKDEGHIRSGRRSDDVKRHHDQNDSRIRRSHLKNSPDHHRSRRGTTDKQSPPLRKRGRDSCERFSRERERNDRHSRIPVRRSRARSWSHSPKRKRYSRELERNNGQSRIHARSSHALSWSRSPERKSRERQRNDGRSRIRARSTHACSWSRSPEKKSREQERNDGRSRIRARSTHACSWSRSPERKSRERDRNDGQSRIRASSTHACSWSRSPERKSRERQRNDGQSRIRARSSHACSWSRSPDRKSRERERNDGRSRIRVRKPHACSRSRSPERKSREQERNDGRSRIRARKPHACSWSRSPERKSHERERNDGRSRVRARKTHACSWSRSPERKSLDRERNDGRSRIRERKTHACSWSRSPEKKSLDRERNDGRSRIRERKTNACSWSCSPEKKSLDRERNDGRSRIRERKTNACSWSCSPEKKSRDRERNDGQSRPRARKNHACSWSRSPEKKSREQERNDGRSRIHARSSHACSWSRSPEKKRPHIPKEEVIQKHHDNSSSNRRKLNPGNSNLSKDDPEKDMFLFNCKANEESKPNDVPEEEDVKCAWVRSAPADLYYERDKANPFVMRATKRTQTLCDIVEEKLLNRASRVRDEKNKQRKEKKEKKNGGCRINECATSVPSIKMNGDSLEKEATEEIKDSIPSEETTELVTKDDKDEDAFEGVEISRKDVVPEVPNSMTVLEKETSEVLNLAPKCKHKQKYKRKRLSHCCASSSDSCSSDSESHGSSSSEDEDDVNDLDRVAKELERKRNHPDRLHPELWFNDPGEMNDGPLCRCSMKAKRSGIRHGYYVGENKLQACDPLTNNADSLHHYRITISPPTNFLIQTPTVIMHDNHEFIFEGFSLLSHHPLEEVPTCRVIRFNIEYTILYIEEKILDNFCIRELDILYKYLFHELLELVDLNLQAMGDNDGCPRFHFMPRFVRKLPENGKEILSMNEVLNYLLKRNVPLMRPEDLASLLNMSQYQWQNYADQLKGMIVTCPGMKPCSIRVDQLDRDQVSEETINYPVIVHFGIRPPQLSYAGNPEYQKAWREYVKFRHLLANMPKPSFEDKRCLEAKENRLQEMRMTSKMKRDVTVAVSAQGFYCTGIMCDVVQHAMLLPVLVCHLRFHRSLEILEKHITYKFKNRFLLQLALTHPSYRENFGTNPDHARNSLTNCGIRQPEYGDRRIHYMNTRKRGINTLINIMSRFGRNTETESKITHNERLEFLGDAVVEFLTSIHLFHLFPSLEEGGLATYRAAIVQNQHLAVLAEKLGLDQFMLYAHGSDLCHDSELRHAMANCFEALMGAIFLDSGIEEADNVLSTTLFKGENELSGIWVHYPPHPLQEQEPQGDRKWISSFPMLSKLAKFEESIGVEFNHIRLLARAFTDRSIGYNNLTLGSNQRLEFLGDTVLQLVASEYLYKYFPEHHEGHLSLLRSSLVNNRTQAVVCDDLGMTTYAMYSHLKTELKTKDRADLLEAFLGALYIDRGLDYCRSFCQVCFFPRLHHFIMNQDWNDPKSKLQQCCLTLRTMDGGEPDIPIYKVIECKGPTNTRVYTVAVYFRGKRLAKASGHSIQQAEMNAARDALMNSKDLFPQLDHQRRVIEKSVKIQGVKPESTSLRDRDRRERKRINPRPRRIERLSRDRPRHQEDSRDSDKSRDRLREEDKRKLSSRRLSDRNGTRLVCRNDRPTLKKGKKRKIKRDRNTEKKEKKSPDDVDDKYTLGGKKNQRDRKNKRTLREREEKKALENRNNKQTANVKDEKKNGDRDKWTLNEKEEKRTPGNKDNKQTIDERKENRSPEVRKDNHTNEENDKDVRVESNEDANFNRL